MFKKLLVISIVLFYLTSCATLFKGTRQDVNFNSDPQKARVVVNGEDMGQTPCSIKLESKKSYKIEFKAEGYKAQIVNISNHIGAGWIILDVLMGLVPVIVDAATGAWYSLDQKNVNAILEKQQ